VKLPRALEFSLQRVLGEGFIHRRRVNPGLQLGDRKAWFPNVKSASSGVMKMGPYETPGTAGAGAGVTIGGMGTPKLAATA
jgi:hypothetical protein